MFWRRELNRHPEFKAGIRDMLPVAPGLGAWGLMSGVAMVKSGLSPLEAAIMTLTVYAGSSQLASLPLLAAGAPLWVIMATAFCVNLRFVVFSAHLRLYLLYLPKVPRLITAYLTTDMSYVMFIKRHPHPSDDAEGRLARSAYLAGNAMVGWVNWMAFSLIGVLLANVLPVEWGLGFAGILALVGILCSLVQTPLQRGLHQRTENAHQRQDAGETQAPFHRQHIGQQHADQAEGHPVDPSHHGIAGQIGAAGQASLGVVARVRMALDEHHVRHVGRQVGRDQPRHLGQIEQVEAKMGAEDHEAQVHAEGGGHDHPQRCTGRQQRQRSQLRAAGIDRQRHDGGFERAQARLHHGHAAHQAPGTQAGRHGQHVADAGLEFRMSVQFTSPEHHVSREVDEPRTPPTGSAWPRRKSPAARRLPPAR